MTRVHRAPRQVTVDSTKFTRWSSPRSLLEHLADELSKYTEWDVGQTESALPPEQAVAQSRFVHEAVLPFVKEYRATVQLASQQEARLLELQLDRLDSHIENVEKFDAARLEVHLAPTRTSSMDKLKMRLSPSGGGTFHWSSVAGGVVNSPKRQSQLPPTVCEHNINKQWHSFILSMGKEMDIAISNNEFQLDPGIMKVGSPARLRLALPTKSNHRLLNHCQLSSR